MNEKFASRLRELRKGSGRTQDDMAGLLGVQRSTYGEYERGKIRPPAEKLLELADYFGVCMGYLSGGSDGRECPLTRSGDARDALMALRRMLLDARHVLGTPSSRLTYSSMSYSVTPYTMLSAIENPRHSRMASRSGLSR